MPEHGEENIAALTAGDRKAWAEVRKKYFSFGVNKKSLHLIESAAFVVILDDNEVFYDPVSFLMITLNNTVIRFCGEFMRILSAHKMFCSKPL